MIFIKKHFDWLFYKNDKLIENYNNLIKKDKVYKVNNNLKLIVENNNYVLKRQGDDYKIIFDFNKKLCTINFFNENLCTEINLLELEIVDKEDNITIIYKLDEEELNKLVISLKE